MTTGLRARLCLVPLVAMLLAASGASATPVRPRPVRVTEDSLASATQDWRRLAADPHRARQRSAWLQVVAELERLGRTGQGPTAALALMRAGRAAEDLARRSGRKADAARAEKLYLDSAELVPTGSLADDALLDAARLEAEALGNESAARHTLERAAAVKGDRRAEALRQLAHMTPAKAEPAKEKTKTRTAKADLSPSPAMVAEAGQRLEEATHELRRLQALPVKKQGREAWQRVVSQLEAAAAVLVPEDAGALAYLRAGRAAEALAGITGRAEDVRHAVTLYLTVADKCPAASVADDALVAAASLESRRLADPAGARRHLEQAIALGGDCAGKARDAARALDDIRSPDAPATAANEELPPVPPAEEREASADVPAPAPAPMPLPASSPALASSVRQLRDKALADTEWSLAEQVGLKIRRIVVDAGHGGHDTGAIGPTGVYEKDVTLAVAKELAASLRTRGYEVVLTRDSDVFLSLEERTQLANREKGDLFISVHANAHKSRQQSGVETYSLNVASDRYAMRLAARENASTERPGSDLPFLLADLATRANTVDSARLAGEVQKSVVQGVARKFGRPKDHGVKHALFYVLLGARMPAVLVETAFLSNPVEEKKLASAGYQNALGKAIADGVDRFVARRSQLASLGN